MPDKPQVDLGLLNIDTLIAETNKEPFRFTLDGKLRELPHFSTLSAKQAIRMDEGEIASILAEISDEKLADRIMSLPGFASDKLIRDWMNHAGSEPGE